VRGCRVPGVGCRGRDGAEPPPRHPTPDA